MRAAAVAVLVVVIMMITPSAWACGHGHRVSNSGHSQWNIGTWSHAHCDGKLHLVRPGHHRKGVRSVKAYGEDNVLVKASGKRTEMLHRHCYKVTGKGWKVISRGE